MKRHPSLAPLSREHHGGLILSQLLKKNAPAYKGMPTDTAGKITYAIQFYITELLPHFDMEEKIGKELMGINSLLDESITEIVEEHVLLRYLFTGIKGNADAESYLDVLGNTLEKHIRKEERIVFPMIEECVDEAMMERIENLLKH